MATEFLIRSATAADAPGICDHIRRHFAESTPEEMIFHPVLDFMDRPREEEIAKIEKRLTLPFPDLGSEAAWIAIDPGTGEVVGHLGLQSSRLPASRHRATLGMGLEHHARGHGLGSKLMDAAVNSARARGLEWIDLYVFAHNKPAIALYTKHGFKPIGTTKDIFRLHGQSIDDTHMALKLSP